MSWRVSDSLLQLRDQVNAEWPNRDKSNDGTIGDTSHQGRHSDHNPDAHGVVRAMDITNDPQLGLVARHLAEQLINSHDPRISYVISNRQIASSSVAPWQWRSYHGASPHTEHMHISVVADDHLADWKKPWTIGSMPVPVPPPEPDPVPTPVPPGPISRFHRWLKPLLEHEGGNDDDPVDPGGRTSRGITQSEYNLWRRTHPGLPSDVWHAPDSTIEAIYKQNYWDKVDGDSLPTGVDYAVFDYGVNSGNSRAAHVLQRLLNVPADGEIGPVTVAAAAKADPRALINQLCDERMHYLRGLPVWWKYHAGWTTRVADVRRDALAAAA